MTAWLLKHLVAVGSNLTCSYLVPNPVICLDRLPPIIERFAIRPPRLPAARATTNKGDMQQPGASRFDQPHGAVEQHRHASPRCIKGPEVLCCEHKFRHRFLRLGGSGLL